MICKGNCIKKHGKNKDLVKVIKSGLVDLENEMDEISEDKIKNERLYDVGSTVKDILYGNDQIQKREGFCLIDHILFLIILNISLKNMKL